MYSTVVSSAILAARIVWNFPVAFRTQTDGAGSRLGLGANQPRVCSRFPLFSSILILSLLPDVETTRNCTNHTARWNVVIVNPRRGRFFFFLFQTSAEMNVLPAPFHQRTYFNIFRLIKRRTFFFLNVRNAWPRHFRCNTRSGANIFFYLYIYIYIYAYNQLNRQSEIDGKELLYNYKREPINRFGPLIIKL